MNARREPPARYELVDHTADIGLAFTGTSAADLFAVAALALADLLFDPQEVSELEERWVGLVAPSREELLVRWLNELIYLRDADSFLWRSVEIRFEGDRRLSAVLRGEVFHPGKHCVRTGVKAATYHLLEVVEVAEGWSARIILDV
jgi:SHS2 domain-containing protein